MTKQQISIAALNDVPETLLIPLLGRAQAFKRFPRYGFRDTWAEDVVAQLDFNPRKFTRDRLAMEGSIVRAAQMDGYARTFFAAHPNGLGVSVGAGLDARFQRIDNGFMEWVDLDLPEVIDIKEQLLAQHDRYRMVRGSLTDPTWVEQIGWEKNRPILISIEGVLVYIPPSEVQKFFVNMANTFTSGATVIFDYAHPFVSDNPATLPSVRKTTARFKWGIRSVDTVTQWHPRLRRVQEKSATLNGPRIYDAGHRVFHTLFRGYLYATAQMQIDAVLEEAS